MKLGIKNNSNYKRYCELCDKYQEFLNHKIPLCAAENYSSNFVLEPLSSQLWGGKYGLSGAFFDESSDFIGGKFIHELLSITTNQCNKLFHSTYSNVRTLTGMNCFTLTVLSCMSICKNMRALITSPDSGGHASIPPILLSLGFEIDYIPFDYSQYCIDYDATNSLLRNKEYGLIVIALSDLLTQPNLDYLDIPQQTLVIFDATQTLGLIAANVIDNPLSSHHDKLLLIGGAHKTLPGPSCGLIMTNNDELSNKIDTGISPVFLRDFQPNNTASLLLSLIETEEIGTSYQQNIVWTANTLADYLSMRNLNVAKLKERYTDTHQIFLLTDKKDMDLIFKNALKFGVTLNKKQKPLFSGYGIRLGVQEIARYNWDRNDLEMLSNILSLFKDKNTNDTLILDLIKSLYEKKNPQFINIV